MSFDLASSVRSCRLERTFEASPHRFYRAWSDPETLTTWFPTEVEGSLVPGTRSRLVWPDQAIWWEVLEADPERRFRFRWPWLADGSLISQVTVDFAPRGSGTRMVLTDGPFDLRELAQLDAWAKCVEGWAQALEFLRGQIDFTVDLRRVRGHVGAGPR